MDKSRSVISRTHSTSSAPAPALSPATIGATISCKAIVDDILHEEVANPNTLRYVNARDEGSLRKLAAELVPSLGQRQQALRGYISQAESGSVQVSDKVKGLWGEKLDAITVILSVLEGAGKAPGELDEEGQANRIAFFKTAKQAWETNLLGVLTALSKEIVGPYTLGEIYIYIIGIDELKMFDTGDQYSIADLHLAGWLARVAKLAGGTNSDDGPTIVKKLEAYIGSEFKGEKLSGFWDAVRERKSWQKVYGGGLI